MGYKTSISAESFKPEDTLFFEVMAKIINCIIVKQQYAMICLHSNREYCLAIKGC